MTEIDDAVTFAVSRHLGQIRKSTGVPYIIHPLKVMEWIRRWGIAERTLDIGAILHDTLEDTNTSEEDIAVNFGPEIRDVVKELTRTDESKQGKIDYLASFKDKSIASLLIKVADRLSNVQDYMFTDWEYAGRYLRKAEPVFEVLLDREKEIVDKYGIAVYAGILKDVYAMYKDTKDGKVNS